MTVPERETHFTVEAPEIRLPEQAAPNVEVKTDVHVPEQAPPTVHVAAPNVTLEAQKPRTVRVEEDPETGDRLYVTE